MPETSRSDTSGHATLAATPARQGRFGKHMFWVLVFGTLLAAIGLFAAWTWKAPALSRASEQQSAAQARREESKVFLIQSPLGQEALRGLHADLPRLSPKRPVGRTIRTSTRMVNPRTGS